MKSDASKLTNDTKEVNKSGGGYNTYICVVFSKICREKIHSIVQKLRDYNGINWLRTPMSYHRFQNLGERIQGNFLNKLRKVLASKDFFINN